MIKFTATIKKFDKQGEKTGWTYIEIPQKTANLLVPNQKTSFRVKGNLDNYKFEQVALLPMGGGDFIMALKADVMKALGKRMGHTLEVNIQADTSPFAFSEEFLNCLTDEPKANTYFNSLPLSHQKYFSKWIESAKTEDTKVKRIVMAVKALSQQKGYGEMIRENKKTI